MRAAIRDRHAADRLLWALGEALGGRAGASGVARESGDRRVPQRLAVLAAMVTLAACGSDETSAARSDST